MNFNVNIFIPQFEGIGLTLRSVNDLITEIYKDGRYKSICKRITKNQVRAEELHSTFILSLLEMGQEQQEFLKSLKAVGNLEVYCVGIINRLWNNRNRIKTHKAETNPLFEYTSTFEVPITYNEDGGIDPDFFSKPDEPYKIEIDYISKEAQQIIDAECDHPDINRMYPARVFKYSYTIYQNPDQFAKAINIPRASIRYTCYKFRDYLNSKLKCLKS